ncbi:hypothetical protein HaLaN_17875 [Haematococcus lacustris]|uniref:Uncharacterized protein n=1 Tax=Haematococcus lacustris TaxID=44745 RepID=A0A699ZQN0_HAELA|nr:hypothetical protein HaLaN_17875 [Haematococcus lacustris]
MSNARSIVAGSLAGPRVTSLVLVTTPPDAESISISCGSLQLHMVEHNGYDKWSISANQVARLLQALLDWDAAFAAQMVLCAAELSSPAKAAEKQCTPAAPAVDHGRAAQHGHTVLRGWQGGGRCPYLITSCTKTRAAWSTPAALQPGPPLPV